MKSFINICLKISGLLLALGIVLCIIGAMTGGIHAVSQFFQDGGYSITFNDASGSSDIEYLDDFSSSFSTDQINNLEVDMKFGEVVVESYDGTEIKVEVENPTDYLTCEQEEDTLSIIDKRSYDSVFTIGSDWWNKHTKVSIYIPENSEFVSAKLEIGAGDMEVDSLLTDSLTIDVGAGEFTGEDLLANKEAEVSVGTGHLQLEDSEFHNISLNGGTGAVELSGKLTGDSELTCGLGSIEVELSEEETDYNYQIKCDIGEVEIGQKSYSGMSTERSVDNQAEDTIIIDCGIGRVAIYFED